MKAINGYLDDGRFTPLDPIKLPKRVQVVLVFEDKSADVNPSDISCRQAEAMRRFREEIRNNDEPVPEFERIKFREIEI